MADDENFEGNNYGILFSHGISDNKESSRKKVGRISYCKAKKVAISAPIMGNSDDGEENKEVLSDQYKVLYEIEESDSVLKNFGEIEKEDSKFPACSISEEMVKEIGEQIGVTWARADEVTNGAKTNKVLDKAIITLNVRESGSIEESWVEEVWGNRNFRYSKLDSNGRLCGIILIWDVIIFVCKDAIGDERFIALRGDWKGLSEDMYLVCLYGPHVCRQKTSLWDKLTGLIERKSRAWCIFGDFNVVRRLDDMMNSQINVKEMDEFNEFINVTLLVEIPMGRRKFTRVSDDGIKFSGGECLEQNRVRADCRFRDKLKNVKIDMKAWSKNKFEAHDEKIEEYKQEALKRNNKNYIRGLIVDGVWSEAPNVIKLEVYILEGILIANETVEYLKRKKEKGLIFKVDFEKAYDSINWAFLSNMMRRMGFGERWCKWIESCLKSSSMSILVNGSPTDEFMLERGVRQADPLSPFLFILAAEGLNALVSEAVDKSIFRGVLVGDERIEVSHLQYSDDTIFLGNGVWKTPMLHGDRYGNRDGDGNGTLKAFGENTCDLGSFGEETDKITDFHQDLPRIMFSERGGGVTSTKRRRLDLFGDDVWISATTS
ncbi:RNA-directed DNA polymerase, eukaryota [Tanacetum coccineum]